MIPLRSPLNVQPHQYIGDSTGRPLDYGRVYFGELNKDPEFYPIDIFYDELLSIAAPQPVRTKGGFLYANGDMTEVYAQELNYSIKVLDSYGRQVFYRANASRVDFTDELRSEFNSKEINTVNIKQFGITGDNSDITAQLMQIIADNPTYTKYYFPDGLYTFSSFFLEKNGIQLVGQSKEGTIFNVVKGTNGVSFRCGKRGSDLETRADNLPVLNGVNPVFDPIDYSPATVDFPRYKDIRVDNVTINIVGSHNGAFEFYRIDGGGFDIAVTFDGAPVVGNAIRTFFCTNLWIPELDTANNPNATFNTFFFWSYGIKGRRWNIGSAIDTALEFKHAINFNVVEVTTAEASMSYSIGYGSKGVAIDKLHCNGTFRAKSSEEFDYSKDIYIRDLTIIEPASVGLLLVNIDNITIDSYYIKAKTPININYGEFFTFSTSSPEITPVQNSAFLTYDGNYDRTQGGKYYEQRNVPSLINSRFGKGVLESTGSMHINVSNTGSSGATTGADGKVVVNTVVGGRGYNESIRVYNKYEENMPRVVKNVDFGDMTLTMPTTPDATIFPLYATNPFDNCKGVIRFVNSPHQLARILYLFNSNFTFIADTDIVGNLYPLTIQSMVNSKINGTIRPRGRVISLDSNVASAYGDGFYNSAFELDIIYADTPSSSPPIYTNLVSPDRWTGLLDVSRTKIYRSDGVSLRAQAVTLITHTTAIPVGVDKNGGGVYTLGGFVDQFIPIHRAYTGETGRIPPQVPNYIGELACNTSVDEWYRAKNLTEWSPL